MDMPVDVQEWERRYIVTVTDTLGMSFLAATTDNAITEELGQGVMPSVRNPNARVLHLQSMATPAAVQVPGQMVVVLDSTVTLDTVLLVMNMQDVLMKGCGHRMYHDVKRFPVFAHHTHRMDTLTAAQA
jgi:hypothetical protein